MIRHRILWLSMAVAVCLLAACATTPKTPQQQQKLRQQAAETLEMVKFNNADLASMLQSAQGVAVFPHVSKGAAGIGGAHGRGVLYEGGTPTGFTTFSQGTIGAQLGGQGYTELVVFNSADALGDFKANNFRFSGQASAVAGHAGSSANADYSEDVAIYTTDETGLMFEAALGAQKFSYKPFPPGTVPAR